MSQGTMKRLIGKVRRKLMPRTVVYAGDGRILAKTSYGTRMYLDVRDIVISPIIALEGWWEPELTDYIQAFLNPGMTFVDVGANMGYFSCIAANAVGRSGKVFAFEADPEVSAFLVDNLKLNWHFSNAHAFNAAAWHEECELTLHRRGKYKGNTSVGRPDDASLSGCGDTVEAFQVKAGPVPMLLPEGTRPDLVKIDVEGAESWVLKGMEPLIAAHPGMTLLVEWSPGQVIQCGGSPTELASFAGRNGMGMRLLEKDGSPVTTEDLASVDHGTIIMQRA